MNLSIRVREEPEVNLTSLIDVVLLLLIFFMVSTSFVKQSQISISLPSQNKNADECPRHPACRFQIVLDESLIGQGFQQYDQGRLDPGRDSHGDDRRDRHRPIGNDIAPQSTVYL